MPKNQNSNNKKVNFNDTNDNESISFNIHDNYYDSSEEKNTSKILTYDDMLASMCMRVQNGNLCMMKDDIEKNNVVDPIERVQKKQNVLPSSNISANTMNNNSYIYNKYFQKYKQNDQPKDDVLDINHIRNLLLSGQITRDDYKRAVLTKLINERNERLRMQKIKSKKLLFSNSNINISGGGIGRPPANMNKLFRFVGPGPSPNPYNQPRPFLIPSNNNNNNNNVK